MRTEGADRMGTAPVGPLIWKTSVPLMLSLLVNSLYNLVDSIFVAHINEEALTALSLASPAQMLIGALGLGLAVGFNAAASRALGAGERDEVRDTAAAAMFLAVVAWLGLAVVSLLALEPYFAWQSGGNERIAAYGLDYLGVCLVGSLGCLGQWVFDRMLIATGRSMGFLATLSTASLTNLILDPVLIFGLGPIPAMGTRGAAIATVIGQFAGAAMGVVINLRWNREIPLRPTLRPRGRCVANILRVGVPTMVMQTLVSVMGVAVNTLLSGFSATAVAVNGVCLKLQNLVTIGPHGINNGLIPMVAYNYGARQRGRITSCLRWALVDSLAMMVVIVGVLELLPGPILQLFDASPQMAAIGTRAIRLLAPSYLAIVLGQMMAAVFQALGKGLYSMCLTVARQVVLLLPLLLVAAGVGSLTLFWLSYTLVELLALPLAWYLWRRTRREVLDRL